MMPAKSGDPGADVSTEVTTTSEQAADFALLESGAREEETAVIAGQGEAQAVAAVELNKEIAGALLMVSRMVAPALPSVGALYTEEVCNTLGNSIAPVCEKYGWLQDGIGGTYGPEILCLCIVGPIAWATVEAAKTDIAARKPAKPESDGISFDASAQVPAQAPGQKTVQFGGIVA